MQSELHRNNVYQSVESLAVTCSYALSAGHSLMPLNVHENFDYAIYINYIYIYIYAKFCLSDQCTS